MMNHRSGSRYRTAARTVVLWRRLGAASGLTRFLSIATLFLTAMAGFAPAPADATVRSAYVANYNDNTVSQYNLDASGALSAKSPATVATGFNPIGVAITPDGKSAYVTNSGSSTVSQYDIDSATGALSANSPATVAAGSGPTYVAVSADGKSAYVTNQGSGTVSQYDIGADGTLTPKTPATVATGAAPITIAVTSNGTSAYVANKSSGTVSQYNIDASGALSPKTPATVTTGAAPQGVVVEGKSVYVTNSGPNTLSQYDISPLDGTLTAKSPATVATGPSPLGGAVSADGKSGYIANLGSFNVSQYDIDQPTGKISPKSTTTVAAGANPLDVAVTADGKSAYVTNSGGMPSTISQYDIDPVSGALSPKSPATVATGTGPYVIAVWPLPTNPTSSARSPAATSSNSFTVTYSAYDRSGSGLASVDLYAKSPGASSYSKVATDSSPGSSGSFSYTVTSGGGSYRFYTIATDNAGNVEAAPASADTTTVFDSQPPSSDASSPAATNSNTFTVTYSAVDRSGFGLATVDLYAKSPSATSYSKVASDSSPGSSGSFSYSATDGGDSYRFYTIATDNVGNVEAAPASADTTTVFDSQPPSSQASSPTQTGTTSFTINYSASDASGSGLATVDLYAKSPSASDYSKVASDSSPDSSGSFAYTAADGDGTYSFYTIATDKAGNVEAAPSSADTSFNTVVSSSASSPAQTSSSSFTVNYSASDGSGPGVATVDLYARSPNASDYSKVATDSSPGSTGSFSYTATDGDGSYSFYTIATDNNGGVEPAPANADTTTVFDTQPPISQASSPSQTEVTSFIVSYSAFDDPGSGLATVDLYAKSPDATEYSKVASDQSPDSGGNFTYTATAGESSYSFYTIATDKAGNVEGAPASPDATTVLDTTPPTSSASSPSHVDSRSFTVSYSASDGPGSGLGKVDLYAKSPSASGYSKVATDSTPGATGSFNFTATDGGGIYGFYTIATDKGGHVEAAPASADTTTDLTPRFENGDFSQGLYAWQEICADFGEVPLGESGCTTTSASGLNTTGSLPYTGAAQTVTAPANAVLTGTVTVNSMSLCADDAALVRVFFDDSDNSNPTQPFVHSALGSLTFYHHPRDGCAQYTYTNTPTSYYQEMPSWVPGTGPQSFSMDMGSLLSKLPGVDPSKVAFLTVEVVNYADDNSPNITFSNLALTPTSPLPASSASSPTNSKSTNLTVNYKASDGMGSGGPGLATVDLYAKSPSASNYTRVATDLSPGSSGSFNYTAADGDGGYSFYTVATDNAGNVEDTPATADTTTLVDTHAPTSSASSPPQTNSNSFSVNYTASDGSGSGLASVDLYAKSPNASGYSKVGTLSSPGTSGSFSYTAADGDGTYRFYTVATDNAGNLEDAPASADTTTLTDSHAPTSSASAPGTTGSSPITVSYSASDGSGSGLASVDLYAKSPSASGYSKVATDSSPGTSGTFSYTAADGYGAYSFYTVATDNLGNVEAAPASADTTTELAITASGTGSASTGSNPTPSEPVATSVTAPDAQTQISIAEEPTNQSPPPAFSFLNWQVEITVSQTASASNPIRLDFALDYSLLAGQDCNGQPCDENTLTVLKDNVAVPDCLGSTTVTSPPACVSARAKLDSACTSNCDVKFTILTTTASTWNFGARKPTCNGKPATIIGTNSSETLTGTSGADVIVGLGGNDTISGAGGNDTICGGDGNDTLDGGAGADVLSGGTGTDSATYATRSTAVSVSLDNAANDGNSGDGPAGARDNVKSDVENLIGGKGADTLTGSSAANSLDGRNGADVLSGLGGIDTATYATRTTAVTVTLDNAANDGNSSDGPAGARDNVKSDIENLIGGSANDTLTGGAAANTLDGRNGADVLSGLGGVDTATYATRTTAVTVTLDNVANDGDSGDGSTHDNVKSDIENVIGGKGADSLTGSAANNKLTGGLGADSLLGLGGNDTLFANDGIADTKIDCGGGTSDVAHVDSHDPAPVGCESVGL
jgi:6-phosphogluconolactonase (cycloisomerase 2 family)